MASALVAYATKYGATKEVAEAIGEVLSGSGVTVDVRPARDVHDVADYSAVILGSALYYFMLHRDAKHFLSRHRKSLASMPVAIFALGPFHDTQEETASARGTVDKYLARNSWLSPVDVAVFGGRHDPATLRFPDNNPAMRGMEPSDARDWTAIREWAQGLREPLGLGSS